MSDQKSTSHDTEDAPATAEAGEFSVAHQARFDTDGAITTEGEVTETSLTDFGADVDTRERESQIDRPEASEFGVDDRPEVTTDGTDGEQVALFADVDPGQQTLTGAEASMRFLFGDEAPPDAGTGTSDD